MKLHKILEQTVPGLGYELVDVEITPTKIIKVFIEKDGGVTIDDCEKVSNHLGNLLFVEEIEYNRLEISSPGLERPLKHLQDFIKFTGKFAKIKTKDLIDGQKVFQGIIKLVDGNDINLELSSAEILKINFDNISRARLVFELQKKIPTRKK
ncbi:MAG: ribosome maturation factor RimP [Proteobacteria bacterium]|jgi:ribosome maturation factor RimP|nr:ribosome maturation factor RimP [Pseudomonadota bacterium]